MSNHPLIDVTVTCVCCRCGMLCQSRLVRRSRWRCRTACRTWLQPTQPCCSRQSQLSAPMSCEPGACLCAGEASAAAGQPFVGRTTLDHKALACALHTLNIPASPSTAEPPWHSLGLDCCLWQRECTMSLCSFSNWFVTMLVCVWFAVCSLCMLPAGWFRNQAL